MNIGSQFDHRGGPSLQGNLPIKETSMPLEDHMQLVSVDDHLIEHPRVWQDRLPQKYREAGPRVIESTGEEVDQNGFGQKISPG